MGEKKNSSMPCISKDLLHFDFTWIELCLVCALCYLLSLFSSLSHMRICHEVTCTHSLRSWCSHLASLLLHCWWKNFILITRFWLLRLLCYDVAWKIDMLMVYWHATWELMVTWISSSLECMNACRTRFFRTQTSLELQQRKRGGETHVTCHTLWYNHLKWWG